MGDDDWFGGGDDAEPEPTPASAPAPAAAAAAADVPAADEAVPEESEPEAPPPPQAEEEFLDPDKLLLFKHWIRPRFLPYKYLTDYRRNYYDDVIDYLDKRNRGITRDIPVAQTWAERALRTYTKDSNLWAIRQIALQDRQLVQDTKFSGKFQLHHGKNYINRRYSTLLY